MDKIIREIFEKYQIRKTKKQKSAFIEYASEKARAEGYSVNVEKGTFGARNIVVGDPDSAKVIYTAHYDTCSRLPFPNFLTPKSIGLYILYNIAVVIGFLVTAFVIGFVCGAAGAVLGLGSEVSGIIAELAYFALLFLMFFGPANKHTANDNTSGVTVLFGIMKALPESDRQKAAFVFFDHEESGLIGSSSFASAHKNVKKNTLILNFDCVSDGKDIMILTKKDAEKYSDLLKSAFAGNEMLTVDVTKKAFYPSDQANFKCGVGIAAFNRTKSGILYLNKIHTDKDRVYKRENIDFLVESSLRFTEAL